MDLKHVHQRILSIHAPPGAIFNLPTNIEKKWLIGVIEPTLSRYTPRLCALGLIQKTGSTRNKRSHWSRLSVYSTTEKYLEYRNRYYEKEDQMAPKAKMSLYNVHKRLLRTRHSKDIFSLPMPGKEFFIGDIAPQLSQFTKGLQQIGLIRKIRTDRRAEHNQLAVVWMTTIKYVEYRNKYSKTR